VSKKRAQHDPPAEAPEASAPESATPGPPGEQAPGEAACASQSGSGETTGEEAGKELPGRQQPEQSAAEGAAGKAAEDVAGAAADVGAAAQQRAGTAEQTSSAQSESDQDQGTEMAALRQRIEQLEAELEQARDRALRFQAELDNYRKRAARELETERRYAALPLMRDLLAVLDNMHRAVEAGRKATGVEGLLEGFEMVARQLEDVLRRHHCVRIEALNAPFDPNYHEAVAQRPSSEHPPNTVLEVTQPGFRLHDRVVRPSRVVVSTSNESE